LSTSGFREYQILTHYPGWNDAVVAAGLQPYTSNQVIDETDLWQDWARLVRRHRHIPTVAAYRREGRHSPRSFEKRFGSWSCLPDRFREFAGGRSEWADVLALLPVTLSADTLDAPSTPVAPAAPHVAEYRRIDTRPTYGNPLDFRGLRHEPVNEQGVVFLFGMVARELGYMVEAVQAGFPDCEAKRQVGPGKWQRVAIEFEFESRNYREHGHPIDGCDLIVCWRHNWPDCPNRLEVVELRTLIKTVAASED
jgi:hypothetical protein